MPSDWMRSPRERERESQEIENKGLRSKPQDTKVQRSWRWGEANKAAGPLRESRPGGQIFEEGRGDQHCVMCWRASKMRTADSQPSRWESIGEQHEREWMGEVGGSRKVCLGQCFGKCDEDRVLEKWICKPLFLLTRFNRHVYYYQSL